MSWAVLREELDRRADEGRSVRFWLRDDDAVVPTAALSKLATISQAFDVAMVIAVIPARSGDEMAGFLKSHRTLLSAVHGWSHANHAPPGAKKQELVAGRPQTLVELSQGFKRLSELHGDCFLPMLVPPWNRIDRALLSFLPGLGFQTLSTFGRSLSAPLRVLNTHVDLIDWRGSRSGRNHSEIIRDVLSGLEIEGPVGILSHHLVSDPGTFDFLEQFLQLTTQHPACRWLAATDLA